jgi:hypothetical protein
LGYITCSFTDSAGPTLDDGDVSDRTPMDTLCFSFMSKGICANAFCPSKHLCRDLVSCLPEMESIFFSRCVRNHPTIVSALSGMLTSTSPLNLQFVTPNDGVITFYTSKLLMAIIHVSSVLTAREHAKVTYCYVPISNYNGKLAFPLL